MHLRGKYHQAKVLKTASEIEGVLTEISAKCAFNKDHVGVFVDFDQFEATSVPWHPSAKYTDKGHSVQRQLLEAILKCITPGVFFISLAGMHSGTADQIQKTIATDNSIYDASKKARSTPMYLCTDEAAANRSRRRGLANVGDVETVLITTAASIKIFNVKRTSRLGVGTTFSIYINNVR